MYVTKLEKNAQKEKEESVDISMGQRGGNLDSKVKLYNYSGFLKEKLLVEVMKSTISLYYQSEIQ